MRQTNRIQPTHIVIKSVDRFLRIIFLCLFIMPIAQCTNPNYLDNKFKIESFAIQRVVDLTNAVEINFKIIYYSDSTYSNYFSSGIERGQDGTDQEILFMGIHGSQSENPFPCNSMTLSEFQNGFNNGERDFRGERLEKPQTICFPHDFDLSTFTIILKDKKTSKQDTLYSTNKKTVAN